MNKYKIIKSVETYIDNDDYEKKIPALLIDLENKINEQTALGWIVNGKVDLSFINIDTQHFAVAFVLMENTNG